jgi:hypothetical protein
VPSIGPSAPTMTPPPVTVPSIGRFAPTMTPPPVTVPSIGAATDGDGL